MNRCSQCGKNFPTERFLNLHIEENHDALVATRRERGEKTVRCYPFLFLPLLYVRCSDANGIICSMHASSKAANGYALRLKNAECI